MCVFQVSYKLKRGMFWIECGCGGTGTWPGVIIDENQCIELKFLCNTYLLGVAYYIKNGKVSDSQL